MPRSRPRYKRKHESSEQFAARQRVWDNSPARVQADAAKAATVQAAAVRRVADAERVANERRQLQYERRATARHVDFFCDYCQTNTSDGRIDEDDPARRYYCGRCWFHWDRAQSST